MKFFRKDRLLIPTEEPRVEIPRGRSLVGYSRRSFLGFGVAAVVLPAVIDNLIAAPTVLSPYILKSLGN